MLLSIGMYIYNCLLQMGFIGYQYSLKWLLEKTTLFAGLIIDRIDVGNHKTVELPFNQLIY